MQKDLDSIVTIVLLLFAPALIIILFVALMAIHVMLGCLVGHAAELFFGDTLRPALKDMFGWSFPLSYIGAAFGFIYSWLSPLFLSAAVAKASK